MSSISVSLVIPAYNEGERLPPYVARLIEEGVRHPAPVVELIVSDDGSTDEHAQALRACVAAARDAWSRAGAPHRISYVAAAQNGGKGSAIRRGWQQVSSGVTWMGHLDADGAIEAVDVFRLAAQAVASPDVDVVAGARIRMAGRRVRRHWGRYLQGRLFAAVADLQLQLRCYDTQCGVKLFRAEVLRPLLPLLREERWLIDVEILALLKRRNARVLEIPIDWTEVGGSKVTPGLDALRMLWGLTRLRRRLMAAP
ncbi:MAG TPA: glycosyltransferase [Kofleriaceae bacterium]|nr:glycosyltransferase [Kofleriaceae bacterium]